MRDTTADFVLGAELLSFRENGQFRQIPARLMRVCPPPGFDGKIRQWYSRGDGRVVVFLVDAKTDDEARAIMETLPLAKEQLMDQVYIPVGPLIALKALMGAPAQQ